MIATLDRHLNAARRRSLLDTLAIGLPILLGASVVTWRLSGVAGAAWPLVIGALALVGIAWRRARRFDHTWLVAALDAKAPALEDSSALLLRPAASLEGLEALQYARLEGRLGQVASLDLRPDWSRRWVALGLGVGAVAILAAAFGPSLKGAASRSPADRIARTPAGPRLAATRLRITPPAYTGQRAFEQNGLDVRAPQNSRIEWTVRLAPSPNAARLSIPGEAPLALRRANGRWSGGRIFERSALYRLEAEGLARQRLHTLEMIPDAPPVIRVVNPSSSLTLTSPGQTRWTPIFEARDDYGVAPTALLRITVTKGEGEVITTTERTLRLTGSGGARRKRFAADLDLRREGLEAGGDMIVQLIVSDNRTPAPRTAEGPSIILRWPTGVGLADGLDGMARQILPVYLRSQRQIIIDAEALIAQKARITPDAFSDRANGLGADQAQLRLRYGQFMGEEAEGGGGLSIPTNDAPASALPTNDGPPSPPAKTEDHDDHGPDDGHGHGAESATFGQMGDVVAQFGHAHDTGDAATLFDPATRSTLAQALDAMWDSERALRQGAPQAALPHARRALTLLKDAQQATRIFLARAPSRLPPVDLSRRLTGKRDGIVSGRLAPLARDPVDTPALEAWQTLSPSGGPAAPLRLDSLAAWVTANENRLANSLALAVAIDMVRNEPDCFDCRQKLRALLWTALERPATGVLRRAPADARGRRYLDALR